jgi:hypothetical protein
MFYILMTFQAIWDNLLDARIRLQKSAITVNKLPNVRITHFVSIYALTICVQPSILVQSTEASAPTNDSLRKMLDEAIALSDDISDLQEVLFSCIML